MINPHNESRNVVGFRLVSTGAVDIERLSSLPTMLPASNGFRARRISEKCSSSDSTHARESRTERPRSLGWASGRAFLSSDLTRSPLSVNYPIPARGPASGLNVLRIARFGSTDYRGLVRYQLRYVRVLVVLNKNAKNVHQRGQRMSLVSTNLINQLIQQRDNSVGLLFCMRNKDDSGK